MNTSTIPSFPRLVVAFLWPRLLLAAVFTLIGHIGVGGDPDAYVLFGGYLRDLIEDPSNASLALRMERHGIVAVDLTYHRLAVVVQQLFEGNLESFLGDTGLSIILIHAAFYVLWDNAFVVPIAQCVLNALAYALLVKKNGFEDARTALIWNPASLYFCATLFKESFTETAIILLLVRTQGRWWMAKIPVLLFLAFLRIEYVLLVAIVFVVFSWPRLASMSWIKLGIGMLVIFLFAPATYADWMIDSGSTGALYSLVYANEFTRRVLGPLVGLILPIPFVLFPLNSFWGVFYSIYGIAYYSVGYRILKAFKFRGSFNGNAYLNAAFIVLMVISYRFTGQSGTKDRYFAPFFPMLIIGMSLLRQSIISNPGFPPLQGEREPLAQSKTPRDTV